MNILMTKKHFVDKKKFYESLEKRYSKVLLVKSRQQKYYSMLEKATGSDSRKTEIRNYSKNGDYQDHYESVYIGEINE